MGRPRGSVPDVMKACLDCGEHAPHGPNKRRPNGLQTYCRECMQLRHVHHHMVKRCHDPLHPKYEHWGALGIKVFPFWHDFHAWRKAMPPRPKGMTIERIDNRGNYEPGNVRWATPLEQAQNTCTNVLLEIEGRTQTLAAWAREKGIHKNTLQRRIAEGMDPYEAVHRPVAVNGRRVPMTPELKSRILELLGEGLSHNKIAKEVGRPQPSVSRWIRNWRAAGEASPEVS